MRRFKTQSTLTRAALTLLVMLTCATAWAETEQLTDDTEVLYSGRTYVVSSNVSTRRLHIQYGDNTGPATLQLNEGCTLTVHSDGIRVFSYQLTIQGTGTLVVTGGIATDDGGTIIINGGNITTYGSGVFPGIGGTNAVIKINGGTVNAFGGTLSAGIGGGMYGGSKHHNFSSITITGGTVTATGGYDSSFGGSAGIGSAATAGGGNIVISSGTITANGGGGSGLGAGAGIGSGCKGTMGDITINGGDITATGGIGGSSSQSCGAGIGSGDRASIGNITITDGTVTVNKSGECAAGLGDGNQANSRGTIKISGGTTTATGGKWGAGIGGAYLTNGGVIEITGGTVNATGDYLGAGIGGGYHGAGGTITISGGTVNATGSTGPWNGVAAAIGGSYERSGGTITISGGTITTSGPIGIGDGSKGNGGITTLTYGNDITKPVITASYNGTVTIVTGKAFKDPSGNVYKGTLSSERKAAIANKAIRPATPAEEAAYFWGEGDGSEGNPYIISSAEGWEYFCDCLQDNDTWNRFSGKTVKLGADISVTRMAGADYHDFLGTFDGGGNKLTFTAEASDSYLAPFSNVLGSSDTDHAVIRNLKVETNITANDCRHMAGLIAKVWGYVDVINCDVTVNINSTKGDNNTDLYPAGIASQVVSSAQLAVSGCTVDGTISTNGKYAGGIIGIAQGSASITNSVSSVTINSSTEGDGTHGGLVAVQANNSGITLDIEGSVFNGKLLGTSTNSCGGFVGWRNKTVNISNSLFAPAEVTIDDSDCYTFSRRGGATITNCYYTEALGEVQGKQTRSITAGEGVTVEFSGTAAEYGTSGITAYGTGIMYDGVLYAGNEEQVSLNLDGSTTGYTASAGTLTGEENPYTLIMPDENVIITANAPLFQRGDVNGDGSVNISDVTALIDYLLSGNASGINLSGADCNQDSSVTISDVTTLIDYLLNGSWN
ncbi:MAG: dockerin type I repeat-containing protein [Muribaculaceae bacterium]|nr:dockerin type I repeat-containing protein [Muribaculaceae bacterium]